MVWSWSGRYPADGNEVLSDPTDNLLRGSALQNGEKGTKYFVRKIDGNPGVRSKNVLPQIVVGEGSSLPQVIDLAFNRLQASNSAVQQSQVQVRMCLGRIAKFQTLARKPLAEMMEDGIVRPADRGSPIRFSRLICIVAGAIEKGDGVQEISPSILSHSEQIGCST